MPLVAQRVYSVDVASGETSRFKATEVVESDYSERRPLLTAFVGVRSEQSFSTTASRTGATYWTHIVCYSKGGRECC